MGLRNILLIPGVTDPVSEINQLLFGAGQQGTFIAPSLTASLISGSTFGTGVETLPDLSPRNNPFSQATSGNRAAWFREPKTGRRNLLERTEEFDNAAWTKQNSTVTQNTADTLAPDGTATAESLIPSNAVNTFSGVFRADSTLAAKTLSCYVKKGSKRFAILLGYNGTSNCWFDLDSGAVGTRGANFSASSIEAIGNGWYRIACVFSTAVAATLNLGIYASDADNSTQCVGDGATAALYIWGAQVETGSTATAYQRVTTAFDVTESGQRDCYGVRADGTDDFYTTASTDFTGTDKVTVFAAVRKLSDAASGTVVELSSNAASNDGAFLLRAPWTATPGYGFFARGTTST